MARFDCNEGSSTCPSVDCADCGHISRRLFLAATAGFGTVFALAGLMSDPAAALPVFEADGGQAGNERRYPIPATDSVTIDRTAQVIVARFEGHVYVFALSCPHQNNAVKWLPKDHRFQCTKHDSQYRPDGLHTSGRATRNMDRYVPRRDGDAVVIDLRQWVQSDKDPAAWAAATIAL